MKKFLTGIFLAVLTLTLVSAGCSLKKTPPNQNNQTGQTGSITYSGQDGQTALDLLKAKYLVVTQAFSAGEFVSSINGTAADTSHYWAFYVNGIESTVGAGQYITKSSDTIEWKLQQINSQL